MRIEYFQLIDRIIDLDLSNLTIRAEAAVPAASTIFEGHFPGHPLMPGVLLIESMAKAMSRKSRLSMPKSLIEWLSGLIVSRGISQVSAMMLATVSKVEGIASLC